MSMMSKVTSLLMTVTDFYKDINPSTLSGSIDIVCVEHADGSMAASPFHVRFGKLQLLRPHEKVVEVRVNDKVVDVQMKVGEHGEAFFVVETDDPVPTDLATSPIASASPPTADSAVDELEPLDLGASLSAATLPPAEHTVHVDHLSPETTVTTTTIPMSESPAQTIIEVVETVVEEEPIIVTAVNTPIGEVPPTTTTDFTAAATATTTTTTTTTVTAVLANDPDSVSVTVADETVNGGYHSASEFEFSDQEAAVVAEIDLPPSPHVAITVDGETSTTDVHPFSDTELEVETRIQQAKAHQSALSDTELEYHELGSSASPSSASNANKWSWGWGKMPVKTDPTPSTSRALPDGTISASPSNPELVATAAAAGDSQDGAAMSRALDAPQQPQQEGPIEVSLAGYRKDLTDADFDAKRITYDQFVSQPAKLLASRDLVVRMDRQFYPWSVAGPMLVAMLAFNRALPSATVDTLLAAAPPATPPPATSSAGSRRSAWRSWWSRSSREDKAANRGVPALGGFHDDPPTPGTGNGPRLTHESRAQTAMPAISGGESADGLLKVGNANAGSPPVRSQSASDVLDSSAGAAAAAAAAAANSSGDEGAVSDSELAMGVAPAKHYLKTLRLTSEQLKSLGLQPGPNHVTFTVTSGLQGAAVCHSRIFLWSSTEQVVISDIDGTITKSDALGHLFTMVGRDWTHSGVASLYTGVRKNGYQMLYLTSRAIGQAQYTRNYLNKVEQGQYQLPDGPVFLSPDRLVAAFTREVIQRRPEEFKVACLRDIRALFSPDTKHPFYAGFGNRHTDAYSYRAVGVPTSRIFTINPAGEVKRELLEGYRATYLDLNHLVDQIFPAVGTRGFDAQFNDWSYWRRELPAVPIDVPGLEDDDEDTDGDGLGDPDAIDAADAGLGIEGEEYFEEGEESYDDEYEGEEDGEYDGEDEGDEEEDDARTRELSRVAEFAAFPYI
ncbi:lipin Ned1 [Blastocladiella emersonii ATCC 22665]|nr:lipin Ned1 [Blastocladiella emersonii ATCC 22665]